MAANESRPDIAQWKRKWPHEFWQKIRNLSLLWEKQKYLRRQTFVSVPLSPIHQILDGFSSWIRALPCHKGKEVIVTSFLFNGQALRKPLRRRRDSGSLPCTNIITGDHLWQYASWLLPIIVCSNCFQSYDMNEGSVRSYLASRLSQEDPLLGCHLNSASYRTVVRILWEVLL